LREIENEIQFGKCRLPHEREKEKPVEWRFVGFQLGEIGEDSEEADTFIVAIVLWPFDRIDDRSDALWHLIG